ncbi:hypothetical protein [Vibrio comitans]
MKKVIKINPHMFNLLIEKGMDNFSVIEARDALYGTAESFSNLEETRKYVYKQLLYFAEKGWLSVFGSHRGKRYSVTNEFKGLTIESRIRCDKKKRASLPANATPKSSLNGLVQEKKKYEVELAVTLGEIEEYQSLLMRFPNSKHEMQPLFNEARERSAKLLGKINALTNWMQVVQGKTIKC